MDQTNLNVIVEKHGKWLRCESGGVKAYLRSADLQGANLRGADLQWADLQLADLRSADMQGANLQGANLRGANLQWADLQGANLRGANLRGANLHLADLRSANLKLANLKLATGDQEFVGVTVSNLTWPVWISPRAGDITIGCQTHSFEQWVKWTAKSKEIIAMHSDAADFWARHKKAIIALAGSMRKDA